MLEIGQIFSEINKLFTKAPGLDGRGVEIASEEAIVRLSGRHLRLDLNHLEDGISRASRTDVLLCPTIRREADELDGADSQSLTSPANTDLSSERGLILLTSGGSPEITRHVYKRPLKERLKEAIPDFGILLLRWSCCIRR
jgi:hypothetical protein